MFKSGFKSGSGSGSRVVQDDRRAFDLFMLGADMLKSDFCQFEVGLMYVHGRAVSTDIEEAFRWWSVAASQGNGVAERNLVRLIEVQPSLGQSPPQGAPRPHFFDVRGALAPL